MKICTICTRLCWRLKCHEKKKHSCIGRRLLVWMWAWILVCLHVSVTLLTGDQSSFRFSPSKSAGISFTLTLTYICQLTQHVDAHQTPGWSSLSKHRGGGHDHMHSSRQTIRQPTMCGSFLVTEVVTRRQAGCQCGAHILTRMYVNGVGGALSCFKICHLYLPTSVMYWKMFISIYVDGLKLFLKWTSEQFILWLWNYRILNDSF